MAIGVGALVFVAIILFARRYFAKLAKSGLTEKYRGKKWSSLEGRNKYPEVDVFRWRGLFFRVALIAALALTIGAFSWTIYDEEVKIPEGALALDEDIEIEIPRSAAPPPPPPPPPPPKIEEVPNEVMLEDDEEIEFVDQSVDMETSVEAPKFVDDNGDEDETVAPPPPPPKEPERREIFKVVEEMPRFPGCEDLNASIEEKKACADKKMLEFIYSHVEYPEIAKENGIEGTVVVQFVVDKDGSVSEIQIARDIGGKCGEEAKRLISLMNEMPEKWIPGRQRGRAVPVMFTLPIKFKLEYN